ncbi:MAG: hypothetical protein GX663_00420 [Clostridiales bacterium]|nr:hypothetical protein [Clostridiales bacterium]
MKRLTEDNKTKLAYLWAGIVIVASILLTVTVMVGSNHVLPIFLGATTICYGPITAILYLREVKNGVFKVEESEDE